jgi:hypothetical protein
MKNPLSLSHSLFLSFFPIALKAFLQTDRLGLTFIVEMREGCFRFFNWNALETKFKGLIDAFNEGERGSIISLLKATIF